MPDTDRVTDERLQQILHDPYMCTNDLHRALAAELVERRAKDYETHSAHLTLARVAGELGCTRDGLDLWFAQHVVADRDKAHARVAELEARIYRVRQVHQPIEALNMRHNPRGRLTRVCSGCGTDDGNWQTYPCPTIRALKENR